MPVCGPKLSLCGLIISTWGIIQLVSNLQLKVKFFKMYSSFIKALMGVFYYVGAVALAEDIPEVEFKNLDQFYADMDQGFKQVRYHIIIFLLVLFNLKYVAECFQLLDSSSTISNHIGSVSTSILGQ